MRRFRVSIVAVGALFVAALACQGSGGYSITRTTFGNKGHIEVSIGSVNGEESYDIEIDENFSWDDVGMDVTLEVGSGLCQAMVLDDSGATALALEAKPGQPARGTATVETDAFGDVGFVLQSDGAEEVKIIIDYTKR